MKLAHLRGLALGLGVAGATACAAPVGPGALGGGSPLGPEAPAPPGVPPGTPVGEGVCVLPLPPEGCQDTPVFPFPSGG